MRQNTRSVILNPQAEMRSRGRQSNRTTYNGKQKTVMDKPNPGPASDIQDRSENRNTEAVADDGICAICQLLLHRPVTTSCRHTLCESCMATWADVSMATTQMEILEVETSSAPFNAVNGIEAKCPMCRTQTSTSPDHQKAQDLKMRYPRAYMKREAEDIALIVDGEIQTITLDIGNKHRYVKPVTGNENSHEWRFFVHPSRTDIIEEVHIHLHRTFHRFKIFHTRPPYEISRLGWGYFTIIADIILKAGYNWVSEDAEGSPDGAEQGLLRLKWTLDFHRYDGRGSMGRSKLKVRNQRGWDKVEAEEGARR